MAGVVGRFLLPFSTKSGTIENHMIVVTRLPTHRNDGSKCSRREFRAILNRVRELFSGFTLEGPYEGIWVDDDGTVFEDTSYKLEVVVTRKQVHQARELFIEFGKQLGQRAIYFEVREGGEIIDIE